MRRRAARRLSTERLAAFPAVAIVGPRQCGKTVLARSFSRTYFDLEQPEDRARLDVEWPALVRGRRLVVLDEAQSMPAVFPRLRGAIDADRRRCGRFLLLGSVSPALMREVSESLAGRLAVVELAPFSAQEVPASRLGDLWLRGGYPDGGILRRGAFPAWQEDYLRLLAERDLPAWGLPAKPQATLRLMRMLAVSQGCEWNASRIGQGLGITYHTVNSHLDWLEGAFLVRRVPPWLPNLRKRLVRSPRVYWRDSGLLHAMLGATTRDALLSQPWVGASWEGFVLQQMAAALAAAGHPAGIHWFRTSDGSTEIDFVLERRSDLWAIECKLTSAPSDADLARLDRAADLIGASRRAIVAPVPRSTWNRHRGILTVPDLLRALVR